MSVPPFIHRVKLRNYKSIASCDVELGPLAILVGTNGSGKSNFLDALALTRQALDTTLDHALRDRGGINEVRRRSGGHPANFEIGLHFTLPKSHEQGYYGFEVASRRDGGFTIRREYCLAGSSNALGESAHFEVKEGKVVRNNLEVRLPQPTSDRLFLVSASNVDEFRPVYDALTDMAFYNFAPDVMRWPQPPDSGELLDPDGHNLSSVLAALERLNLPRFKRIQSYLSKVTPGVEGVQRIAIGNLETLQFRQQVAGQSAAWRFPAINMSDGTLRALAVLTALLQGDDAAHSPSLVGIEEPEIALHPAAAGILWDAMGDAQERAQVLVTTHSADLLDRKDVPAEAILATHSEAGITEIGPIVESSRRSLRDRLMSAGELLRQGRLTPSEKALLAPAYQQSHFDEV